jgi:hypothetical protein
MIRRIIREITEIKREVATLRQTSAPGTLTSVTSRGTYKRVNPISENQSTTSAGSKAPRWQ